MGNSDQGVTTMACCEKCEHPSPPAKAPCCSSPGPRPVLIPRGHHRPPLVFSGRTGYLQVARKAMLKSTVLAGALDVSPAIPMDGANRLTIDGSVIFLNPGTQFQISAEGSNDTDSWFNPGGGILFQFRSEERRVGKECCG